MTVTPSLLTIDVGDQVQYQADIYDPSQFAALAPPTTPITPRNYFVAMVIADIVKVNGHPAKGTYVGRTRVIRASPLPGSGGAIADITRLAMREHFFEILNNTDMSPIGTIMSTGFSCGDAPPGTGMPPDEHGNWAVVGGTGLYLGARGQVRSTVPTPPPPLTPQTGGRNASMTKDPGQRHDNGQRNAFVLQVIPMDPPRIISTPAWPLIFHSSNHTPVTVLTPAVASDHLSLFASGLGPTQPDVDLAQPFPLIPPSKMKLPFTIAVNGVAAHNVSAVGVPGEVNVYEVKFTIPAAAIPPGTNLVPIQLSVGWIVGPSVNIWVA